MLPKSSVARVVTAAALLGAVGGAAFVAWPDDSAHAAAEKAPAAGTASVEGVWRMDGYGTVLEISHGRLQEYQTTAVSCIEGDSARRTGGGGGAATYTSADKTVYRLRTGAGHRAGPAGQAWLHIDGAPNDRGLRRIAALPGDCATAPASGAEKTEGRAGRSTATSAAPGPDSDSAHDPVHVFDVFWRTFEENYPFFAAKGVDWHAVRDRYRPKVHAGMSDRQLRDVLREMIAPLNDAHVYLADPSGVFARTRPGTVLPGPELDKRAVSLIEERDLAGRRLRRFARGRIGYADLPHDQGYLRISGFGGYTDDRDDSYAANSAELDKALDAVFTHRRTARLRGLIIDLRINGGGSDSLGLKIAERLTDRGYRAYAKQARNDPDDPARFTRLQPIPVRPADGPRYTGPVAVLTGGSTFSAGETFTQALMDRPGGSIRIGEHTQGVFSDVLVRALPNGWEFGLPNEVFRTRDGRTFDGPGIPPDFSEPVFTEEEFRLHRDSAFDRAVAVLRARR